MSFRRIALIALPLAAALVGAAAMWWAAGMPAYTDPERAAKLMGPDFPESWAVWHAEMEQIRTAKWTLHGIGFGLVVLAGALALATLRFRLWGPGSVARMTTPHSRWSYLLLTTMVWIGFGLASTFDLVEDHHRGDVHPLDDAAERSTPYFVMVLLIGLSLSMSFKLMTLHRASLPIALWAWNDRHRSASWLFTVVYGFQTALLMLFAFSSAVQGDWLAIPLLLGVYSTLSMRAVRVAEGRAHRAPGRYVGKLR